MSNQFEKLSSLLEELFQTNQADLDFGIYRVINQRRDEINRFLDKELLSHVKEAFAGYQAVDASALDKELKNAIKQAEDLGVSPEEAPRVKEIRERMATYSVDVTDLENQVYSALYNFFRRYYDDGDFISQRRYKEGIYAIPYEGEEVKLHWANHDQYYIKSSEYFRDYSFKLPSGKRAHFNLIEADTEKDNRKENNDNKRRFILAAEPLAWENGEIQIRFEFRPDEENRSQDKCNAASAETIFGLRKSLKDQAQKDNLAELTAPAPTESNKDRTLLEKHLEDYTRRNTQDYFIHKDLGKFLRRELDFFIKNEIMHLDNIENESAPRVEQYLSRIKVIRQIAHRIIDFLAQIEDFQKKLWLKKKFVVETNYCITLDRVPEELYPEIAANDAQREEWVHLFAIDEIRGDMFKSEYSKPLTVEFLQENPYLVVDTIFFDEDFKQRLFSEQDNLDDSLNGLLLHSENTQAIHLINPKYLASVKCIYLDPPYNTSEETFLYKNQFKHSSWLSMMNSRTFDSVPLLSDDGAMIFAIDDEELYRFKNALDSLFGVESDLGTIVVQSNPRGRGINSYFATSHDYYLYYSPNPENVRIVDQPLTPEQKKEFGHEDEESSFRLLPFRRSGGLSTPDERPNSEFSIYYSPEDKLIVGVGGERKYKYPEEYEPSSIFALGPDGQIKEYPGNHFASKDDVIAIMPTDTSGSRRVWRWSNREKILHAAAAGDFIVRSQDDGFSVLLKDRIKKGRKPKTIWSDSKYDASSHGTNLIKDMFGERKLFGYPKSIHSTFDAIHTLVGDDADAVILDFFAGSGTTGHAVIDMDRAEGEDSFRKYILVEMGQYFEAVTKPRIQKAIYSQDWHNGKPKSRNGISHAFKYVRLESYEDTLNNLVLLRKDEQQKALEESQGFKEDYILHYMLDIESQSSLLDMHRFETPFDYQLHIASSTVGETTPTKIDLVETFNYLLGLHVQTIRKLDGVVVVRGYTRDERQILILWRNVPDMDNDKLDAFFKEHVVGGLDGVTDIYVNGDNNLANLRSKDQHWNVHLTEESFHKLMFEE